MKSIYLILVSCIIFTSHLFSQKRPGFDSSSTKELDSLVVYGYIYGYRTYLPEVQNGFLLTGKKTEQIFLTNTNADLSSKIGRQVFSKIPGIFIYDMDGAGNQINIATRGLDPHRGWDFNIRKDGILTNSDMYGYPASHYNMPLESIERIELVRGTGSLQYGAQFGGMLSYINKRADSTKPFSFESINTIGSYHLLSSYNAISGTIGKFKYYAYINRKTREGYRKFEQTNSSSEAVILEFEPNKKFSARLEWARSSYIYRMPGQLSDDMFEKDPTQATRFRNYFNPDINIPSLTINWQIQKNTNIKFTSSAVIGNRNSVLFDKPANILDTINVATQQYNNRQVDIDGFNSYTSELRVLHNYFLGNMQHVLVSGIQIMQNDLHRQQLGKGTTGSDFDLNLVDPNWGRDLHFKSKNWAFFLENKWQLTHLLSLTSGFRIEKGQSDMSGTISYYPLQHIPVTIAHQFPLFGATMQYQLSEKTQAYAGWSQSYRPMIFKDLIPASLYEKVDPTIKDVHGDNAEIGFRGNAGLLKWDITGFLLREYNRYGTLAETDASGNLYTYRTNIGNSISKGLELFIQADWNLGNQNSIIAYTSTAFMHARYQDAFVKKGNQNISIEGNKIESAPDFTTRNSIGFKSRGFSVSVLYSYTAATFADPLNTINPTPATGAVGLVPSYGLVDLNTSLRISKMIEARINISNLTDQHYFTKRPLFYPGPGIWPSDGRNFSVSISFKI